MGTLDLTHVLDEDDTTAGGIERNLDINSDATETGAMVLNGTLVEIESSAMHPFVCVTSGPTGSLNRLTNALFNQVLGNAHSVKCV